MHEEPQLSRRERQIMDVLHARGSASAAGVRAALPDPPSYSAVRALLRILEGKGHIRHRAQGTRYLYQPRKSRQTASRSALRRVVATFFDGSTSRAVAALLEEADTELSDRELNELEKRVKEARKEGR